MRIRSARPVHQAPSPRGFRTLGKFSLAVTDDITIADCSLVEAPDGNFLLYGPGRDNSSLNVSRETRIIIIEMALAALGIEQHDRDNAA